jgi:DNA-binding response OmpR family regulator
MSATKRGTVVIVEDSAESAALLADIVEAEGFDTLVCTTGGDAVEQAASRKPVAVLLDWGLPDRPGIDVCREIRATNSALPIIFVSGRDDETSIARGLDAGADDYVAKPVRAGELMARVEAHLRRVEALRPNHNGSSHHDAKVRLGALEIDVGARSVRRHGRPVALGQLEFKLLEYLLRNAGTAVSRDQIMSEVYGYDADVSSERVDLLVRRLRSKLGGEEIDAVIAAVPGYGYRLDRRGGRP